MRNGPDLDFILSSCPGEPGRVLLVPFGKIQARRSAGNLGFEQVKTMRGQNYPFGCRILTGSIACYVLYSLLFVSATSKQYGIFDIVSRIAAKYL